MSLNLPITSRRIKNHFHYSLWKYLVLIVLAAFGWNLIFTTTRYRPPESAKVEFFAEGTLSGSDALQGLADQIHAEIMPEMEEVTATTVTFDDAYGDMQLVVWVSAAQGDVYLISQARFLSMASGDGTLDLAPYVQSGALHTDGIDLSAGYVRSADNLTQSLMGIPADSLTKLNDYGAITEGMVLCVLATGGNDDYAIEFLDYLLTQMRETDAAQTPAETEATGGETAAAPDAAATDAPTATATEAPTATPTAKPTATPTAKPTATPTAKPTATPTAKPTPTTPVQPTASPAA